MSEKEKENRKKDRSYWSDDDYTIHESDYSDSISESLRKFWYYLFGGLS